MCPLRFILVFFSAILAGYFAWRTVCSSPGTTHDMMIISQEEDSTNQNDKSSKKEDFNLKMMVENGFWAFVDMASGKYLWRNLNLKEMMIKQEKLVKSC